MAGIPTWTAVVAAAIRDAEGRVLLQRALPGKAHSGLWEFPGGKVDRGENPRDAVIREVNEELSLTLDRATLASAGFAESEPGEGGTAIVLLFYTAANFFGEPVPNEGQEWGWFTLQEAANLPLAPLDRVLFGQLAG